MDDFDKVAHALQSLAQEVDHMTDSEMLELGHAATTLILTRTKAGIDVDGVPFIPYTDEYAKERQQHGLATRVDLARTGHMLGALVPIVTAPGEVTLSFSNPLEAQKALAHNEGVKKSSVLVKAHSRGTFVNKKGQRVSRDEVRRDQKRKNKRLTLRVENVSQHERDMKTPKREFMDIRQPREIDALSEMIGKQLRLRVEKIVK